MFSSMSTVTLEDARRDFGRLFHRCCEEKRSSSKSRPARRSAPSPSAGGSEAAPPGYFADDYSTEEIAELNQLAAQGPSRLVS